MQSKLANPRISVNPRRFLFTEYYINFPILYFQRHRTTQFVYRCACIMHVACRAPLSLWHVKLQYIGSRYELRQRRLIDAASKAGGWLVPSIKQHHPVTTDCKMFYGRPYYRNSHYVCCGSLFPLSFFFLRPFSGIANWPIFNPHQTLPLCSVVALLLKCI